MSPHGKAVFILTIHILFFSKEKAFTSIEKESFHMTRSQAIDCLKRILTGHKILSSKAGYF